MTKGKPESAPAEVEALLGRLRKWLHSKAPAPSPHPPEKEVAAYVDWLVAGAPGACPVPQVREHVADCTECFRGVATLTVAHLQARREAARQPLGDFFLTLARDLRNSFVQWTNDLGRRVEERLAEPGPKGHAVAYYAPGPFMLPTPREAEPFSDEPVRTGRASISLPDVDLTLTARLTPGGGTELTVVARDRWTRRPLRDLRVELLDWAGVLVDEATTDNDGTAVFRILYPGHYRIEIIQQR